MIFPFSAQVKESVERALPLIHSHLIEGLPEEVVGLVLSDGSIIPLINQARSSSRFEVSVAQMADVLASIDPEVRTVYALYHSHPAKELSLSFLDQRNLQIHYRTGLSVPWLVMIPDGSARMWWMDGDYGLPASYQFPLDLIYA